MMDNNGQRPIAISHLSYSGDLKNIDKISKYAKYTDAEFAHIFSYIMKSR